MKSNYRKLEAEYEIIPLSGEEIPWMVNLRIKKAKKKGCTGILLYGFIRSGPRSISKKKPVVAVREGGRRLCLCGSTSRLPKLVRLDCGTHEFVFKAVRQMSSSEFRKQVMLGEGDLLVALCDPIQPWNVLKASPKADTWYLGILDQAGNIRLLDS